MNDEKEVIEFWKFLEILQTKKFNPQKDEKENKSRKCKVLKNTYSKKDYSITVTFNEKRANFIINGNKFGWNIDDKYFARTIHDTDLPPEFIDDLENLLSTLSVEQISEYWF